MSTRFNKPPLIELIAEFRWNVASQKLNPHIPEAMPQPRIAADVQEQNALFSRFSDYISEKKFQRVERIVPPDFPLFVNEPIFRIRSNDEKEVLYNIGVGCFTINAVPPYKTWDSFEPKIRDGIEALLKALSSDNGENKTTFSFASLRYIDAFNSHLANNLEIHSFIEQVFGIKIELPPGITKHKASDKAIKPTLHLQVPIDAFTNMQLGIGEGLVNTELVFMLDTYVAASNKEIQPDVDQMMEPLNKAHRIIHELFFDITKPISNLMEPE